MFKLKKPQKLRKKHKVLLAGVALLAIGGVSGILLKVRDAQALAADANFRVVMPYFGGATQGTNVYLEISQPGNNNSLDAPEAWAKVYIDKDRVDDATIGIFAGGYANGVDSQGPKFQGSGGSFPDNNTTKYEFYLGRDVKEDGFFDERPCGTASTEKLSGSMSATGWWKIDASRFKGYKCGINPWKVASKSGKYVIFVRASWTGKNPLADGRLNAFKVGAAYENPRNNFDNPLTGYWSNYTVATTPGRPAAAAYSVQDRKSPDGTQGDYTFRFAPDCRIPPGEVDSKQRYLHWKDVDYPGFYSGQTPPEFEVTEIAPNGQRRSVAKVTKDTVINGGSPFGQDKHASIPFKGKGGYKYEWTWKNITRVDGVSFWLPYDDYPALAGCGDWSHELKMQAGPDGRYIPSNTTEFKVGGGQTATINLTQNATGDDAGPETDVELTVAATNGRSINTSFSGISTELGGTTSSASTANTRILRWENLDPIGGANPLTRKNIIARFVVAENAPDGARYCASAVMSPKSNTEPGGTRSTPNQICFTIDNSLKPFVSTSGADVHAGDCTVTVDGKFTGLDGKITGPPANGGTKGSSGSYIVSAGDEITNFGSGGSASGGALTFGKGGKYGSICRPKISDIEKYFLKDTGRYVDADDPFYLDFDKNFMLNKLPDKGRFRIKANRDISLVGLSTANVTIFAPDHTVTLRGGTVGSKADAPAIRSQLPVVGIAAKTIKVSKDTSTINAVMYATDSFNTCSITDWVNQCKSTLKMNGFAMAGSFLFRRVSGASYGLQVGEQIDFNAAFYLNPPPGFGVPANQIKYLGEKAPLY